MATEIIEEPATLKAPEFFKAGARYSIDPGAGTKDLAGDAYQLILSAHAVLNECVDSDQSYAALHLLEMGRNVLSEVLGRLEVPGFKLAPVTPIE